MASGYSNSANDKGGATLLPTSALPKSLSSQPVLIYMPNLLSSHFLCHHRAFVDVPVGAGKMYEKSVFQFCSYSPDSFANLAPQSL